MDNADDEGNVHFSGAWKFARKATPHSPAMAERRLAPILPARRTERARKAHSSLRPPTRLTPVRFSR